MTDIDLPSPSESPPAPSFPPVDSYAERFASCPLPVMGPPISSPCILSMDPAEPEPTESHPSRVRPLDDNVLLYLKPLPKRMQAGLIELPGNRKGKSNGAREAIVLATGPGWRLRGGRGPLVPTEVQPGQCVVVDAKAGQDWAFDVAKPRTNPAGCAWESFPVPTVHERPGGEYRMVRADEILFELEGQRPEDEALELDYGDGGRR